MKKQKITQQDYLKAHRKASREEEIARLEAEAVLEKYDKEMEAVL